jgi:hypothetical protein
MKKATSIEILQKIPIIIDVEALLYNRESSRRVRIAKIIKFSD